MTTCKTEPSTLIDLCDVGEIISQQFQSSYIKDCYKRMIQEAILGEIVSDGDSQKQTTLTVSEIADKVLDLLSE
jgi:hypothetical protein